MVQGVSKMFSGECSVRDGMEKYDQLLGRGRRGRNRVRWVLDRSHKRYRNQTEKRWEERPGMKLGAVSRMCRKWFCAAKL